MPFDLKTAMAHRAPMLMVDELLEVDKDTALTSFEVKADNIFLDGSSGLLERSALIEIMAQALAAKSAFKAYQDGLPTQKGFLVVLKNIDFLDDAKLGDTLKCQVKVADFISQTYIANCKITNNAGKTLAAGELRIYSFDKI
ncbi:MAG: hypothetical protein LBM71_02930 [Elusimicrobiota bacterium]|jgi:predicted hotdog family 3-hydroxylacyl-ACP dehydratase|nr:hypothetical protein [Elusimicrobiota bacterium]